MTWVILWLVLEVVVILVVANAMARSRAKLGTILAAGVALSLLGLGGFIAVMFATGVAR